MSGTFILVNPNGRKGHLGKEWPTLEKTVLEALGEHSAKVVFTTEDEHGSNLVRNGLAEGAKKIVVIGGDGTLSEAVRGFFVNGKNNHSDAVFIPLPAGSGDDFFKALHAEKWKQPQPTVENGIQLMKDASPQWIDVGEFQWLGPQATDEKQNFINVVGFGFPGLLVDKVRKNTGTLGHYFLSKGSWTYRVHGLSAIGEYQPLAVSVKVDGKIFYEGKIFLGLILNGRYSAGGLCWDSTSTINDGLFNIIIVPPMNWLQILKLMPSGLFKSELDIPGMVKAVGKSVEVRLLENEIKHHPLFEIDGDILEKKETRGAVFNVIPKAIQIPSFV